MFPTLPRPRPHPRPRRCQLDRQLRPQHGATETNASHDPATRATRPGTRQPGASDASCQACARRGSASASRPNVSGWKHEEERACARDGHDPPRPAQDFALALRSDLLGSARLAMLPCCHIAILLISILPFTICHRYCRYHARANPMALICSPSNAASNFSREGSRVGSGRAPSPPVLYTGTERHPDLDSSRVPSRGTCLRTRK